METLIVCSISLLATVILWRGSKVRRTYNLLWLGMGILCVLCLAGCGANWAQTAQELGGVVAGLIPIAASLGSALLPAEAQSITEYATTVQVGLQEVEKVIKDYNGQPSDSTLSKVTASIADVQKNLAGLEVAAHVSDPVAQKRLGAIVSAVSTALPVLEASIQGKHTVTVAYHQG